MRREKLVVFLKITKKNLVVFFTVPINKYIKKKKRNSAEGAEDFLAGKNSR